VLLIITGSLDGTSDLICQSVGQKVFRFNYDIFKEYRLEFFKDSWRITNPTGHSISSENISSCFWWKAFNYPITNEDPFIVEEVSYIFKEIYTWCELRGLVKGNPPDYHNHYGKLNLLNTASKYFKTPKTLFSLNGEGIRLLDKSSVVAKSLTATLTSNKGTLLTTEIDIKKIDTKYPWFLQEKINSDFDITVFICQKHIYAYERSRKNLKGLDWRGEQNADVKVKEWFKFELNESDIRAINGFCKDINVEWGRIDFMRAEEGLIFLEFNANGQWVFLDYFGEAGLVKIVSDYLTA